MPVFEEFLSELKTLGQKAEAWLEGEAVKVESFLAPLIKQLEAVGITFLEKDGAQIAAAAAAGFAAGQPEAAVLAGAVTAVKTLAESQGVQLGEIALSGIASTLAAQGQTQNAANPENTVNQ